VAKDYKMLVIIKTKNRNMEERLFPKWFFIFARIFVVLIIFTIVQEYFLDGNLNKEGVCLVVSIVFLMLIASAINGNG